MKRYKTFLGSIVAGIFLTLAPQIGGTPPVGGLFIALVLVAVAGNIAGIWLRRLDRWTRLDQARLARTLGGLCVGVAIATFAAISLIEFDGFALILATLSALVGSGVSVWGWKS